MPNTIFDVMQSMQKPQQPGIMELINTIRNSPNPNAAMQQMASSNPAIQNVMNYIQMTGGDAKTAFYNMAAQKGVDPESILRFLR